MPVLQGSLDRERKRWQEEGRQEGHREGRREERENMALSMLKDGFNNEIILKHTNLSKEELDKLKKRPT